MDMLDSWFESIRNGNLKEIISIHKNNPDLINKFTTINDGRNNYQTNAIIEASFQGNRDLVKWLIENNADVNSTSDGGWRPIHFAAQHGHVTTVNLLVLGGAEVNVETEAKETPILFALQAYMRDTVKKLLYHGASLVGIDRNYLQMCIQKDILDPAFLNEPNKAYLSDPNTYMKIDSNGYDIMNRQHAQDMEEIKPIKLIGSKVVTEYDNELKRRRQELLKKMRRSNEPPNSLAPLIRKIAQLDGDSEKIALVKEILALINSADGIVPQTKFSDQMINILELCLCDSTSSDEFITVTGQLMMTILHNNIRRGDAAVVEFWCRIFDKMTNLQIEQYTLQILKMLLHMIDNATDGVVSNLKSNKDSFLQNWEYFFENLCFPKCLNLSLIILRNIHRHCADAVIERFHNVIDIMIGWCIHPDTDLATMVSLCERSVDLHECWLADPGNLKKTLANLQKDILSHCQVLSRIHRVDKDRAQVDELKLKIKFYCFALSCVTAGVSRIADISKIQFHSNGNSGNIAAVSHILPNPFVVGIIEKLAEGLIICSKQIDFDNLLLQSNTVILHLLSVLNRNDGGIGTVFQCVFRYVFGTSLPLQSHIMTEGSGNTNYHNRQLISSYFDLITLCLGKIQLEPSTVVQILSPVNWIHSCIFYGSSVDHNLMEKYLRLVDIIARSPCVTTLYQILLSDLELAVNTLMKSSNCANLLRLVQSNAFKTKTYEPAQAELVVKYNINLILLLHGNLSEDANSSTAVLIPSVPILFTKYLLFTEASMLDKYSSVAVFIMRAVARLQPGPDLIPEFLRFLCLLLGTSNLDCASTNEAFDIFKQILVSPPALLFSNNELINVVISSLTDIIHRELGTELMTIDCLEIVFDLVQSHESVISKTNEDNLLNVAINASNHTSHTIRGICFRLYFHLLTKISTPVSHQSFASEIKSIQSISTSGRSFKFPIDFSRTIFQWIIDSTDRSSFTSRQFLRLGDLQSISNNRLLTVYTVILNACWDCVRQKLRFDPNADSRVTLMTMENIVKSILTNGNSLRSVTDKRFRKMMSAFAAKPPSDQSVSVNLLLLLLEKLEKLFYNSYEGCCVGFPPATKSTETFFTTNRHVCTEWFAKMRLLIVALAQYAGQWSTVVWHGMALLKSNFDHRNTRILVPEIEDCIVLTSMALSRLGNWESLIGLHRVAVDIYGSKFDWIEALADKTAGWLETAIQKFESYIGDHHDPDNRSARHSSEMRLLTRKSNTTSHSSFILCMEEIADCYKLLTEPDGLSRWQSQLHKWKSSDSMPEAHKSTVNWDRLICLTKLSQWSPSTASDETDNSGGVPPALRSLQDVSWKYRSVIDHCEDIAFLSLFDTDRNTGSSFAHQQQSIIGNLSSLQSISDFPNAFTNPDIILINERLKQQQQQQPIDYRDLEHYSRTLPLSVINFANALQNRDNDHNRQSQFFAHQKYLIQWHRKHRNFTKSQRLVDDSFSAFLNNQSSPSPIVQMQLERELLKLLWNNDQRMEALKLLTSSLKDGLLFETSDPSLHSAKCQLNTKSLLTLFQWINGQLKSTFRDSVLADERISTNLQFLIELAEVPWINGLPLVSPQQRSMEKHCHAPATDVCSQILILASKSHNQDRNSDKSFMTLAQWCLSRSRSLDDSPNPVDLIQSPLNNRLSPDTLANIELLFQTNFSPSQMKCDTDWLGDCYEDPSFIDELKSSVMALDPELTAEMADEVTAIWQESVCQHFSLHIAAAEAYFSFLKDKTTPDRNQATANLRILSLLGRRSRSLRDSIIAKIKLSPPAAWINVIPQLFARLKHSDGRVRTCMAELLQRLAVSSTGGGKLIIYPTLVGAINEIDNARSPYHEIKRVLVDNNRALVDEVSVFIRELRRITVLWDELWVSSLGQCYDELNKKAHQLQAEIDRIDCQDSQVTAAAAANSSIGSNHSSTKDVILKLKYNSIIQAAVFILERTQSATNIVPETPRECWFHNMFAEEISNTINEIKSPTDIREFNDAWKKIKDLQEIILTESNNNIKIKVKRGRHHFLSLKLDEVSPSLSKINASLIPLPGMNDKQLMSIDGHISILPTKTKPKKFHFLASDGKGYNYLYKGLEDLRLDERVMQILGIANTMFSKMNEREAHKYHITTYPVTPLGTRAGLIQMVEDATSLFSLYKRHQMRNKSALDLLKSRVRHSNNNGETNEATIVSEEGYPIRPTDIYWQKLRPKLEAAKIDLSFDNRDKWPLAILIEVLTELNKETPPDLLSKELWCCSINSSNWYKSSINFTRSSAIMSIMGHLLGLGDRHLDNLLVNFSTGQMVHIDYNVCFDKGVSLKVPEKVPFRLTDIITFVFGPMGVEGLFKISAQNVYEIIQQSQDSILTLMDTFIFDPIVDWSSGIESGHYGSFEGGKFSVNSTKSIVEKRSVEFIINLNNFQAVMVTMEEELGICQERLMEEFTGVKENLHNTWLVCQEIQEIRALYTKKQDMIELLRSYEHRGGCDLIDQFNYVRSLENRSLGLECDIQKRLQQLKSVNNDHSAFFNKLLSTPDFISLKLDIKNIRLFFEEHLANIEKSSTVFGEYCDSDDDIRRYSEIFQELALLGDTIDQVPGCLVLVEKYRAVVQEMPQSYYTSDRCSYMLRITEQLAKNCSLDSITGHLEGYAPRWMELETEDDIEQFHTEQRNWSVLLKAESELMAELQKKIAVQSHEEEIQELENIWQLTMFENVAGINIFKAVLLEQYMEMANITSQLDTTVVSKIPDTISLAIDYNVTLRKYLQLLNAHENYFKILTNSMNMFGIYLNTNEAAMVGNMMLTLQKTCVTVLTFESKFIDIILPESVKIMKQLSSDDCDLLDELKAIAKEGDNIMLHFNIAFTSTSYDIKNYDNIHQKTVVPLKDKIAQWADIGGVPIHDTTKQLRILIASFYTTIHQTYLLCCDFIDCCMNSSTPSSWNYIDLVAASSINISPIWNKSIKLLKDALYMSGIRCLVGTLDQCKSFTESIVANTGTLDDPDQLAATFNNLLKHLEIYFNFINKHILVGVASQCFGKMFCLLLEHAGWNIDTLIAENLVNNCSALNAEFICGSVVSFRKSEYPNAVNFYTQLQYRFNNYKTITGFAIEPNLGTRFLSRNISLHKSLGNLARNQLISLCWTKKHLLQHGDNTDSDVAPLLELIDAIDRVPDRLASLKTVLLQLESINGKFHLIDEEIQSKSPEASLALSKASADRSQSINSVKKRILLVNDVLLNIDRFECLRSRSERGNQFDREVVEFLSTSKDTQEQLSGCHGLIKPIEEDIIKLKAEWKLENANWWVDLLDILHKEIGTSADEVRDKEDKMRDIALSQEKEARSLKTNLSEYYYPLINLLKPSLRVLHSVTKKLSAHLAVLDEDKEESLESYSIRYRVEHVLRLTDLFEKFNFTVDSCVRFLCRGATEFEELDISEYIDRLRTQFDSITLVRDSVVPDLFSTLLALSPEEYREPGDPRDHGRTTETDASATSTKTPVPSQFGFSNNNMADATRISPSLSGGADSKATNSSSKKPQPPLQPATASTTNNNSNNSIGVQKAIEVWKLIETRLNPKPIITSTTTTAATSLSSEPSPPPQPSSSSSTPSSSSSQPAANDIDRKLKPPAAAAAPTSVISQHVDKLIKAARSADNLARMYEGWTAWV